MSTKLPCVLTINESYSDGSAGIQVDLKTFTALSTFGMSVITALAARNDSDMKSIHTVPEDFISSQLHHVTSNHTINALKIGVKFSPSLIECIVLVLTKMKVPFVVTDMMAVTTELSPNSLNILRKQLLPITTLVIVTVNEAVILLERDIISLDEMKRAARDLHSLGSKYVLIKGDQLILNENSLVIDVLFDGEHFTQFHSPRISTSNTNSTRCTLSAAVTAYLARGIDVIHAIQLGIAYTHSIAQNSLVSVNKLHDPFIINKEQQQPSQSENTDKVVFVSSELWIHEPQILLQKRSFFQFLKNSCLQEWVDYTHHPFVQALADGTLPHESFKHYLIQDYIFLIHFARCYSIAAYKSTNMTEILIASEKACYIARESELHVSYCAEWGIDTKSLTSTNEARANLAYTRFTLDRGMTGDLLDLYVALSPCVLGYGEIGLRLFNEPSTKRDSPYWKWILSYAGDDYQKGCRESEELLDRLADEYGVWHASVRLNTLKDTFKTATKLEIGFWNMGLHIEW